jgi:hypothetical protein
MTRMLLRVVAESIGVRPEDFGKDMPHQWACPICGKAPVKRQDEPCEDCGEPGAA